MPRTLVEANPSFVKLLFNDFSKNLMIPPKFVRLHPGTLTKECILRPTHTQNSWCVRTKQIENDLYFKKGWKFFAKHHSLKYGDFLLFTYDPQVSEFDVVMFDKSCCSKDPLVISHEEEEKLSMVIRDTPQFLPEDENKKGRSSCSGFTTANEKHSVEAFEAANKLLSRSKHPTHLIVIQPNNLSKGYLIVSGEFFKGMNMKEGSMNVKLHYSGKEWGAAWRRSATLSSRITRGWCTFAKENSLKTGDICVLELINREEAVIKVSIFK